MRGLLSIGELAKLQDISKQTLIYYDTIGLFCPVYKDAKTGYRFYSMKQIDFLDTILILKKMGLSLQEIKTFMKSYSIDESIEILQKQIPVLEKQIADLEMIKSRVQHRCDTLENIQRIHSLGSKVYVENINAQKLYVEAVDPPYTLEQMSIATKRCFVKAHQNHIPIFFQSGAIVPLSNIYRGDFTIASHAFLTCEQNADFQDVIELRAGRVVSMYHIGTYETIGLTYKKILAYCEKEGLTLCSDSYEFAINDYLSTNKESEYITKLMFYIE